MILFRLPTAVLSEAISWLDTKSHFRLVCVCYYLKRVARLPTSSPALIIVDRHLYSWPQSLLALRPARLRIASSLSRHLLEEVLNPNTNLVALSLVLKTWNHLPTLHPLKRLRSLELTVCQCLDSEDAVLPTSLQELTISTELTNSCALVFLLPLTNLTRLDLRCFRHDSFLGLQLHGCLQRLRALRVFRLSPAAMSAVAYELPCLEALMVEEADFSTIYKPAFPVLEQLIVGLGLEPTPKRWRKWSCCRRCVCWNWRRVP